MLNFQDLIDNISEALESADGEFVAEMHNKICSKEVVYENDTLWKYVNDDDYKIVLNEKQREKINHSVSKMLEANKEPYNARQYEHYQAVTHVFLMDIIGKTMFYKIDNSQGSWNWGGNASYADDAQAAIDAYYNEYGIE